MMCVQMDLFKVMIIPLYKYHEDTHSSASGRSGHIGEASLSTLQVDPPATSASRQHW